MCSCLILFCMLETVHHRKKEEEKQGKRSCFSFFADKETEAQTGLQPSPCWSPPFCPGAPSTSERHVTSLGRDLAPWFAENQSPSFPDSSTNPWIYDSWLLGPRRRSLNVCCRHPNAGACLTVWGFWVYSTKFNVCVGYIVSSSSGLATAFIVNPPLQHKAAALQSFYWNHSASGHQHCPD